MKIRCLKLLDGTILSVSAPDIDFEVLNETEDEITIKIKKR